MYANSFLPSIYFRPSNLSCKSSIDFSLSTNDLWTLTSTESSGTDNSFETEQMGVANRSKVAPPTDQGNCSFLLKSTLI